MTAQELIRDFQRMWTEKWGYISGAAGGIWTQSNQDAADEKTRKYSQQWVGHRVADCSGAFVWAFKQHGLGIYHGSNRIAREHVEALLPMAQAQPGMAVFKTREPGEKYYALPAEYRKGGKRCNGDLKDYYHIGLVDADGQHVLHCANTQDGFVRGGIGQGWCAAAKLKQVEYAEAGDTLENLLRMAREAIDAVLTRIKEEGWNI